MNSLFFIARNNIKKHKGEAAILFLLMFMAAVLLFVSLSMLMSKDNTIRKNTEEFHTPSLLVFGPEDLSAEESEEIINSVPSTSGCESVEFVFGTGSYYYGDMSEEDAISNEFYFLDGTGDNYLCSLPEGASELADDEILLPYYIANSHPVGSTYTIKINGYEKTFTVKGYVENLFFSTAMSVSGYLNVVSRDAYIEIQEALDPMFTRYLIYADAADGVDAEDYENEVLKAFEGKAGVSTFNYNLAVLAATSTTLIASAIVLVFTVVLVALAILIMYFSIKNFIELNTQNIGLLQATGYMVKELRFACIAEQMIICVLATAAAVVAGLFLNQPLCALSGSLMGLSGFSGLCVPALIATLVGIPVAVLIGSFFATGSYRKLTVLESLRSGITAHNFKRNHFELENSRLPLDLAISGKHIFGSLKKSVFLTLIIAVLTLAMCLGFCLYQNWVIDQSNLLKLVGFETSDIQIYCAGDENMLDELKNHDGVRRINTWTTMSSVEVMYLDNSTTLNIDVYQDLESLEQEYLLEGHVPSNENEIVLTTVEADKLGVTVGDIVTVRTSDGTGTASFLVSGIDQKINNGGNKALMSESGAMRVNPDYTFEDVLLFLDDGIDVKKFKSDLEEEYPGYQMSLTEDVINTALNTLTASMKAICVIFVVVTCFVVILTEILLTRSQVIRERTDLGVSKALGYTSGELIRRTLMTNMPIIVTGIVLGFVMHVALSDKLILLGLAMFGIRQNSFPTPPVWFILSGAIILVCAVVTSYLCGRGISKLEPVAILTEE